MTIASSFTILPTRGIILCVRRSKHSKQWILSFPNAYNFMFRLQVFNYNNNSAFTSFDISLIFSYPCTIYTYILFNIIVIKKLSIDTAVVIYEYMLQYTVNNYISHHVLQVPTLQSTDVQYLYIQRYKYVYTYFIQSVR